MHKARFAAYVQLGGKLRDMELLIHIKIRTRALGRRVWVEFAQATISLPKDCDVLDAIAFKRRVRGYANKTGKLPNLIAWRDQYFAA